LERVPYTGVKLLKLTEACNVTEGLPSIEVKYWDPLLFDTATLGVQSAVIKSGIEVFKLREVVETCARHGFELLYWTPNVDATADIEEKEWFTGYVAAQRVEFRLPLAGYYPHTPIPNRPGRSR
jgi:hypothetical protein